MSDGVRGIGSFVRELCVAVISVVIVTQFYQPAHVSGSSMKPQFFQGDYLLLSRQAYQNRKPQRGDVVVFQSTLQDKKGRKERLIKRIVGLPGETVEIRDGQVYINGSLLIDNYTRTHYTNGSLQITVPSDSYFCMGDNRQNSTDSRSPAVGCVSSDRLCGKVVLRLWPARRAGVVKSYGELAEEKSPAGTAVSSAASGKAAPSGKK